MARFASRKCDRTDEAAGRLQSIRNLLVIERGRQQLTQGRRGALGLHHMAFEQKNHIVQQLSVTLRSTRITAPLMKIRSPVLRLIGMPFFTAAPRQSGGKLR